MEKEKGAKMHQALLENIPYLAWLKDIEGKYLLVNKAFADLYHISTDHIVGKTDFDLCSREKALEFQKSDEEVIKSRKQHFIEQVESLPLGNALFETYKTPVVNKKGKVVGIAGISREITDRTWMEKTLHEREEQFRALLQNSSDAISIINRQGKIIFEGSEKDKILDFGIEELLHKSFFEIVHPDDVLQIRAVFKEVLPVRANRSRRNTEACIRTEGGYTWRAFSPISLKILRLRELL
jgi:PAS domain S-box-containing protein